MAVLIICSILVVTLFYLFAKRKYSYWDRKGFKSIPVHSYFLGQFKDAFFGKSNLVDVFQKLYDSTKEPFIGFYGILRPLLLVRDPEIARAIMIKDFSHFTDRGIASNEDYDPLTGNLFSLQGNKWKNMRAKLTPTFTSGKLKEMFATLVECGLKLQNHLDGHAKNNELLNLRDVSARHSTNVIASVAFGIEVDTLKNPNHEFRVNGLKIFETSVWNSIRVLLNVIQPKLMRLLRIRSVDRSVEDFIKSVVIQNLEYREKNNVSRKDFFQLLMQLRKDGTVQLDDQFKTVIKADKSLESLTIDEMAAQVFLFFSAGFETTSSTLSFCLYEMAKNSEIMERAMIEVDEVLAKHNGQISYESVSAMKYLDHCIDETLRMYPPAGQLFRKCIKDYKIPGTDLTIEKDTDLFIPVHQFHHDEKYFPEPKTFDPDRFLEENLAGTNLIDRPYYPFGDGPRNCIGMRLAKLQITVGLTMILQKFTVKLEDRHKSEELQFEKRSFLLTPVGGINFHVFKR